MGAERQRRLEGGRDRAHHRLGSQERAGGRKTHQSNGAPPHDPLGKPILKRKTAIQLHRLTRTDGTSTPSGGQPLHGTETAARAPRAHPQSAVERPARRATGNTTGSDRQALRTRVGRSLGARVAAAWLLVSCITLGLSSLEASAQTVKLVSNSSATGPATHATVDEDVTQTQEFTTGSHPTGYSLNAVILDGALTRPTATLSVSIYDESSGNPGSNIATLSGGTGVTQGLTNIFTAPQGTVLAPETKYFVFIEGTNSNAASLQPTSGNGEDTDSADGWSIADSRRYRTTDGGTWRSDGGTLRLSLRGTLIMPPTITDMEVTSDPGIDETYGIGHTANVSIRFSEQVSVDTSSGMPQLILNIGESTETVVCAAHATDLDTLVCSYEVAENDADTDGISIGENSLTLNGATITYRGTTVSAELDHVGFPSNPGHKVNGDATVPTITGVGITSTPSYSDDTYGAGEAIEVSVTFSLPVWKTLAPAASLFLPGWKAATFHAGNGTRTLRFRYTVVAADMDGNGVTIATNLLSHQGNTNQRLQGSGTIKSSAGVDANVANTSRNNLGAHRVDGSLTSSMATPNAPTTVIATADGADEIHLTWTTPTWPGTSAITGYKVERGPSATGPWTDAGSPTETRLDDNGLDAATTYHYRVRGMNTSGNGDWSTTTSATTAADLVCARTAEIRDAIVAATPAGACAKVTATQLGEITSLDASEKAIGALAVGDFAGLTGLKRLDLSGNQIPTLSRNLFSDLGALTTLDVSDNGLQGVTSGSFDGLSSVTTLDVGGNDFNTVASGLFTPLSALTSLDASDGTLARVSESTLDEAFSGRPLTTLDLGSNGWSELPEGILIGLASLATLDLGGNTVDPLPVIVTLKRVERAKFKAVIPAGAPFAAALPVTVTGGTLDGTPATVTVSAGTRDSGERTVIPANPRTGAVTVTVGTLPAKPSGHSGYVLKASEDLPITVVGEPATVTIEGESGQIIANAWDNADFTLTRTPAGGAIDVEVEVTESDTFVIAVSVGTQTVPFQDGEATATLSLRLIRNPSGDGTITATVQAGDDNTVGTPASATVNVVDINPAMDVVFRDDTISVEEGNNVIVHVVGTTAAGVDHPSMDHPTGVTVSTRKAEAKPEDGDYTPLSAEVFFAYEDFTRNTDGRWVGTTTAEITTHDDTEYEGTEQFSAKLEGTAALSGRITVAGTVTPREDFVTIQLTDNEPPPPPTDIIASGITATTMALVWMGPEIADGDEITGYQIEWSLTGSDPWEVATNLQDYNSPSWDQAVDHHGRTPDTPYFYRLSTQNVHGTGEPSEIKSGRTHVDLVCGRTPQIRDWIVEAVTFASECGEVRESNLNGLSGHMRLTNAGITELRTGDLDGLTGITELLLDRNQLDDVTRRPFRRDEIIGRSGARLQPADDTSTKYFQESVGSQHHIAHPQSIRNSARRTICRNRRIQSRTRSLRRRNGRDYRGGPFSCGMKYVEESKGTTYCGEDV